MAQQDTGEATLRTESPDIVHDEQLGHLANQEEHESGRLEAFVKHPWACFWCGFACWCLILFTFEVQAGGAVLGIPQFRKDFGSEFQGGYVLDTQWQSAFNGAPTAAAIFGSLGAAEVADRIGRKYTLAAALLISIAAISIEVTATTNPLFFGGKFLNGFAIGAIQAVMVTYIGEIVPLALRGVFTCLGAVGYGVGPLVAFIVVNYTGTTDTRWAYRTVFCCQYGFAGIALILVGFMPESPWWLVSHNQNEKALTNIKKLGYTGDAATKKLALIELTLEEIKRESEGATYLECFRRSNLRRTIVSIMPEIIQMMTGITFVAGYFTYYLQLAGYSTKESFKIQIAQPVLSILGNLTAAFFIDRVGRRDLTFWTLLVLVVVLLITGGLATAGSPSDTKGTVSLILIFSYLYNVGIGSTAFTILCETSTSRLRVKTIAIGVSAQNAVNVFWSFILPYMFNPDKANLGGKVAFVFGGFSFFCLVYLWLYQPETAFRSYEELDEMFMKGIPARKFKGFKTDAEAMGEAVKDNVEFDTLGKNAVLHAEVV